MWVEDSAVVLGPPRSGKGLHRVIPLIRSEGGGTGITTIAVLQSLAQARTRWGRDAAQAIWDSAIVKVVLGGGSNASDLSDLSRLIGERDALERSESWSGTDGRRSVSLSKRQRPLRCLWM
jgi:type IV secretion system protein VirD4